MYRLSNPVVPNGKSYYVGLIEQNLWISLTESSSDLETFKAQINEGAAQLQDADGNLMTAEQAKDFVKELP